MIAYDCVTTPLGVSREMLIHAYGVDCLQDESSIVLVAKSIDEYEGLELPPNNSGYFHDRAYLKHLQAVVKILSPTSAKVHTSLHCPLSNLT